jgi:hypothetical protein
MKKTLVLSLSLFVFTMTAGASMLRVAAVPSSNTIVTDGGAVITLRGVVVPAAEEAVARDYLAGLLAGRWITVDGGDVFRSPDALFVNGEMARRAWMSPIVKMTNLGEVYSGPRTLSRTPAPRTRVRASTARSAARRR